MELVELEFLGCAWPWVMNSKVLLLSKPGAGKYWHWDLLEFQVFAPKCIEGVE